MPFDYLAFDASARTYDLDGRLRVKVSHISKACVSPYRGSEIPHAETLGLEPDRVYQLLRDPEELARSVPTWNGVQVLIKHTPVSADDPQHDKVVGSLGTEAAFRDPYLDNALTFWDGEAITGIETGEQRQLSGGYHYRADMTPGVWNGIPFDGVMRNITGNHVALVRTGRAGADVMVMDEAMRDVATDKGKHIMGKKAATPSPRTAVALGALQVYLPPKLAKGQAMPDLSRLIAGATSGKIMADRVTRAVQGRLAQDADLTDLANIIDALKGGVSDPDPALAVADPPLGGPPVAAVADPDDVVDPDAPVIDPNNPLHDPDDDDAEDDDIEAKVRELLAGKLDDADLEMLLKLIQPDPVPTAEPPPAAPPPPAVAAKPDDDKAKDNGLPRPGGGRDDLPANLKENQVDKPAMDAAIRAAVAQVEARHNAKTERAVAEATAKITARLNARDEAKSFVRSWIDTSNVPAMDSAEDWLFLAMDTMGVPTEDIPKNLPIPAYKAILNAVPKAGEEPARPRRLAQDAAAVTSLMERFPALKNARVAG